MSKIIIYNVKKFIFKKVIYLVICIIIIFNILSTIVKFFCKLLFLNILIDKLSNFVAFFLIWYFEIYIFIIILINFFLSLLKNLLCYLYSMLVKFLLFFEDKILTEFLLFIKNKILTKFFSFVQNKIIKIFVFFKYKLGEENSLKIKNFFLKTKELYFIEEDKIIRIRSFENLKNYFYTTKSILEDVFYREWERIKPLLYEWFRFYGDLFLEYFYLFFNRLDQLESTEAILGQQKKEFIEDWTNFFNWIARNIKNFKIEFIYLTKYFISELKFINKSAKIVIFFYFKKWSFSYVYWTSIFVKRSFVNKFLILILLIFIAKLIKILIILFFFNFLKFKIIKIPFFVLFNYYRKFKRRIFTALRHVYLRTFRHLTLKWIFFYSKKYKKFFTSCGFRFKYKRILKGEVFIHYSLIEKWINPLTDNFFFRFFTRRFNRLRAKYRLHRMSIKFRRRFSFYKYFGVAIQIVKVILRRILRLLISSFFFMVTSIDKVVRFIIKKWF